MFLLPFWGLKVETPGSTRLQSSSKTACQINEKASKQLEFHPKQNRRKGNEGKGERECQLNLLNHLLLVEACGVLLGCDPHLDVVSELLDEVDVDISQEQRCADLLQHRINSLQCQKGRRTKGRKDTEEEQNKKKRIRKRKKERKNKK